MASKDKKAPVTQPLETPPAAFEELFDSLTPPVVEEAPQPLPEPHETAPQYVVATHPLWINHNPFNGDRPWELRRGDFFSGPKAAWLWEHHREYVKPKTFTR